MARNVKINKNFNKYIPDKWKIKENFLKKEIEDLVTHEMQKAEVLHDFFALGSALGTPPKLQKAKEGAGRMRSTSPWNLMRCNQQT